MRGRDSRNGEAPSSDVCSKLALWLFAVNIVIVVPCAMHPTRRRRRLQTAPVTTAVRRDQATREQGQKDVRITES
ncbi:uncharacterized protein PHACADRAFT_252231 [Phanerochaete carnosa HHB-10118-sp]|uniref:Uncharacterized protein n=1 Tax=Phanerochaete carnosa (strain HHB-10118-sp) TaxID=650164 RepID=K5WFR1_PHACS|nr:uncharacterized protein PHACADRAFT_252231 [Phanerochaete carnosa HHB-10118-sp]EKM58150.1 hypothetical protein PHACADRAFT_252231 [Phanerochaete carnosa HHB-10118-sp]